MAGWNRGPYVSTRCPDGRIVHRYKDAHIPLDPEEAGRRAVSTLVAKFTRDYGYAPTSEEALAYINGSIEGYRAGRI